MAPSGIGVRLRASKKEGSSGSAKASARDLLRVAENSRRENLEWATSAPDDQFSRIILRGIEANNLVWGKIWRRSEKRKRNHRRRARKMLVHPKQITSGP